MELKQKDDKLAQTWSVEVNEQEKPNASIFPVASADKVLLENAKKSMVCVDHDQMKELKISGRSSSPTGRSLMIEFYPCLDPNGAENICMPSTAVRNAFSPKTNLVVLHN